MIRRAPGARFGYNSAGPSGAVGAMRLVREARAHLSRIGLTAQAGGVRTDPQVRRGDVATGPFRHQLPTTDSPAKEISTLLPRCRVQPSTADRPHAPILHRGPQT